ncbi:MAG: DUF262 domain-containing protein [Polyangiaceae bacterium]
MPDPEGVQPYATKERDEAKDEQEQLGEAEPTIVETKFPLDIAKKEFTIFELHRRWRAGHLRLQPEFQRELVWLEEKQTKLVESVLARIPLPVIYFSDDGNSFDVVDGQQRLTTLFAFMEGRVADKQAPEAIRRRGEDQTGGRAFALRRLTLLTKLEGHTFETLDPKDRRSFEETQLICYVLPPSTSAEAKFQIFGRLNEGGVPLNFQELRNALFRGAALDLVRRLACPGSRFRQVAGSYRSYARMRADELVLRGIAFANGNWRNEYRGDLKVFLNESLQALNRAGTDELERVERSFLHGVDFAERVFGENAWQRYDPGKAEWSGHISGPLVEVVSAAARSVFPGVLPSDEQASRIRERFEALCATQEFVGAILTATQTVKNVKARMTAFEEICRDAR